MTNPLTSRRTALAGTRRSPIALFVAFALVAQSAWAADEIAIADVKHEGPVDFEREVLPILKRNCIACHNHASQKGELVLETPQTILAGGSNGAAAEPGQGDDSLLIQVASHQSEPIMPPVDNKVAASPLTPEELGLIRLWINEGAKGEVRNRAAAVSWQPLPPGVNPIYSVAVSPDGEYAACGRANQIYIYDLKSGKFLCQLTDPNLLDGQPYSKPGVAHRDLVHSLAFSPDGYTLASGDYRAVKLWQRPRNVKRFELALGDAPVALAVASPDQKRIATAGADGRIRLWDATTGAAGPVLEGNQAAVTGIRFAADGTRLYSASLDQSIRAWDLASAKQIAALVTPAPIAALALSADGAQLVTGGPDAVLRSWSTAFPADDQLLSVPTPITHMSASADQKRLALGLADGQAQVVDAAARNVQRSIPAHAAGRTVAALSVDGQWLATGGADAQVKIWNLAADEPALIGNGPAAVTDVVWLPNNEQLIAATADGKLTLWSRAGATPGAVPLKVLRQFALSPATIQTIALAADGALVYVAGDDGVLRAVQTSDGAGKFTAPHGAIIADVSISPDGKLIATAGADQIVKFWNAADGTAAPAPATAALGSAATACSFSADGRFVVAALADNRLLAIDAASAAVAQPLTSLQGPARALVPMADSILSAGDDKLVRAAKIAALRRLSGHTQAVTALESLPGGPRVVSGSSDGTVREWDLATGGEVRKLEHGGPVTSIAVRPDGARIASASDNHTVRLWNTADGKQLAEIRGDFKSQQLIAALSTRQTIARQNNDAAKAAYEAAEKDKTDKLAAVKTAEENHAKSVVASDEAAAKAKVAVDAQQTADKLAGEATARSKAALEAKAATEKLAGDLGTTVALATDAAQKAQAAVDTEANANAAVAALALATKIATEKATAEAPLVEMNTAAQKLSTDTASMDQGLKTLQASLAKFVAEKTAALTAATEKKAADEKAAAEAEAAAKSAAEAKAAADKAATEAQAAAQAALESRQTAEKAIGDAKRSAKLADETVPLRKSAWDETAAIAAGFEQSIAAVNAAAAKHDQPWRAVAFSADNSLLAAAGDDGVVRTYHADDGAGFEEFAGATARVATLAFTGAGLLAAADDKSAALWDLYPVWTHAGELGPASPSAADLPSSVFADRVLTLAFSPDGKLLATGGGEPSRSGELKIWNLAERRVVLDLPDAHSDTLFGLDFSPNGKYIASCGADKFVRVFEVATGKQVRSFEGHTHHVLGVAWQADGKVLASCGADSVIKVWNLETGEQQRTIAGFGKEVTSINFQGVTPMLVSSSGDKTVRLHNSADGANPRNFGGASDFVYATRVTADGRLVVAGGQDSVLRVWDSADGKSLFSFEPPKP